MIELILFIAGTSQTREIDSFSYDAGLASFVYTAGHSQVSCAPVTRFAYNNGNVFVEAGGCAVGDSIFDSGFES